MCGRGPTVPGEMRSVIVPENMRGESVRAFFTTKHVGAGTASISRYAGVLERDIHLPLQRHTASVSILRGDMIRREADAIVTRRRNVLVGVRVSDCVPILLYDARTRACGAVHAGWRGTAAGIVARSIEAMVRNFSSSPLDIRIAIGPAIRWCCYHVREDVLGAVQAATGSGEYSLWREGKICLDLPTANMLQASAAGIPRSAIWMSQECTFCNPLRFYSYRYQGRVAGSQGGFIGVLKGAARGDI